VRDDDRSLPLGQEREEPTHFQSAQDRGGRIVRREVGHGRFADSAKQAAPGLSERNAIEPTL